MELYQFIWKRKITSKTLADELECSPNAIGNLKNRKSSPSLLTALKMEKYSEGQLVLTDLLSNDDAEKYKKWLASYSKEEYK